MSRASPSYAAGLMSGTSADGMSAAVVSLAGERPIVRLAGWTTLGYPPRFRARLLALAAGEAAPASEFARLEVELARWGARAVARAAARAGVPVRRLTFVASPGHTLFHGPDGARPATWQADDPGALAARLACDVVADFRRRDVAAGGQGAPLAPWAHHRLFAHPREPRVILNLGGIANVTWLPAGAGPDRVAAFDTGPANVLLDLLAEAGSAGRLARDEGGRLAGRGRVATPRLAALLRHPYFRRRPPKSTGREVFGRPLLPRFRGLGPADALATATEFTARSVADQVGRWLPPAARRATVYVSGGGARNPILLRRLRAALSPRPVRPLATLGFPAQAVEPACFALLGWARLRGIPNVLPAVTGARAAVCAGVVARAR